ncbi:MAG: hypothetical protein WBP65_13235 [Candidatus Sulfotelmatobacter sp.]|jgi:hypothetical protein
MATVRACRKKTRPEHLPGTSDGVAFTSIRQRLDEVLVRVGQFELDSPLNQARSINISPYDIYSEPKLATELVAHDHIQV